MEDAELEEIRKRKLEQMQEQVQAKQQEQIQIQQQIQALENFVKTRLTKEALIRYGNLKAGHPQLAIQILVVLSEAIKSGKVNMVDDDLLKSILKEMQPKKETKIIRK